MTGRSMLFFALASLLACLTGCASDDSSELSLLDPHVEHYGKTYAQWAAAWVQYVNRYHPPKCANPLVDTTGAACAVDQRSEDPVVFFVGAFGGKVQRKCDVPADKALFFPLVNLWGDNAGVPAAMTLSDAELREAVETAFDGFDPSKSWLRLDGQSVGKLDQSGVRAEPYVLDFAPGDNSYVCSMAPPVSGKFPGWVSGYWAMLAPLSPGAHTLEFGVSSTKSDPNFRLDVRYELQVR
jgi:hypothetical protein